MSYPWQIQTLIVEDEQEPTENYRSIFKELKDAAPPFFAPSFDEAVKQLASSSIFHLVIIDLGLPQATHEVTQQGVEPGIDLVLRAAHREDYPIPTLLVISGRLGQARLNELHETLTQEFWYGRMVNKGIDESDAIDAALQKVHEYCGVGIHVRDGGGKLCPTLSPREEDLLRRCVLSQQQCIGLDLEWWGAYHGSSSPVPATEVNATKVLMGRFLLQDGHEASRPTFFKFEASEIAKLSHQDVAVMVQKLSHVKLCTAMRTSRRSLLVTQQVGDSSDRPISLAEFLVLPSAEISGAISRIMADIAAQLASLGTVSEDRFALPELLWQWHDTNTLRETWKRYRGAAESKPIQLLEALKASNELWWVARRSCTHGDLNATNIALDRAGGDWRAYIFDAAGVKADVAVRDLAMLEVTSLLHGNVALDDHLVEDCKPLYVPGTIIEDTCPTDSAISIHRNTYELIREIRRQALEIGDLKTYALMVFDCAMLQVGGLGVQGHGNKIRNPRAALLLADLAAVWISSLAPNLVGVTAEAVANS
jgi:CheY-like chemotaxis protein